MTQPFAMTLLFPSTRWAAGLAILSVTLFLAGCSKPPTAKVDNLQLARFYADNGTYSLALSTLTQEQQKTPKNPQLYRELAEIYLELGYSLDALGAIDKALEFGCNSNDCAELRLRALIAGGKLKEAEQQLEGIGKRLAKPLRDFYQAQIDYRKDGDRKQAIARLQAIDLPQAHSEYLRLLFADGQYQKLAELYEQAKGKPVQADDWLVFAKALFMVKNHEEADRALVQQRLADKGDVITPRKIEAVELQVKNNIAQNKFAEAQAIYDAFLENYKGSGYVAMQDALKDLKSKNYDSAIKNIERLAQSSPDNLQTALILSLAKFGKGDYQAVVDTLSLFRDRLNTGAKDLLAKAYLNLRRPDPVIDLLQGETSPELRMDLAGAWLQKGNKDQARSLVGSLDPKPLKETELLQYAQLLAPLGEYQRIEQALSSRELKDPRLQQLLVSVLLQQKRPDEAERYARSLSDPRQSLELQIQLALQQKDRNKALQLQEKLTRSRQSKADEARLAALYLANQQVDEGFAAIQRGFAKPGSNAAFLKMLRVLLQKGDYPQVRQWMEKQSSSVEGYDELQLLLAEADLKDHPEQARQRLQPLLERNDPRAVVLMARSDPQNGEKILRQSLDRKYQPSIARLLYQYYIGKGDQEGYARLLQRIEKDQADSPGKDAMLARAYLRLGELTRAETHADALAKKGYQAQALELKGDIHLAAKRPAKAVEAYREALGMKSADALAAKYIQARIAAGEERKKVFDEAGELLRQHPDYTALKGLLASSLLQSKPDQAIKLYEQILEQQRNNVTAMNNLAWLYLERDAKRALQLSEAAFRLAPRNLDVADTYIRALYRNGRKTQGRKLLDELREKNPDSHMLKQLSQELS